VSVGIRCRSDFVLPVCVIQGASVPSGTVQSRRRLERALKGEVLLYLVLFDDWRGTSRQLGGIYCYGSNIETSLPVCVRACEHAAMISAVLQLFCFPRFGVDRRGVICVPCQNI